MLTELTYRLRNGSNYFQKFDLNSYDDRIDASPEISLFEYHILRESKTGKTLFWNQTLKHEKIEKSGYVSVSYIHEQDIKDALDKISEEFYNFIGSNEDKIITEIEKYPEKLANIIQSINQWNGWFYT